MNSTCSEANLNTIYKDLFRAGEKSIEDTDAIENELEKLDDKVINVLKKTKNLNELNQDDRSVLSKFIMSLFMRHPQTIDTVKDMISNKAISEINIIGSSAKNINKPEQKDQFLKSTNLKEMMKVLNDKETYLKVENMHWELVEAENIEFFSGYNPLVINFGKRTKIFSKAFGLSLSPGLLLVGFENAIFDGSKYKKDKEIKKFSKKYNYYVCKQSDYIVVSKELTDEQYKTVFGDI